MIKSERIVVAMSGGVDSSVAACLLKEEGYEVIGITMCFNLPDVSSKKPRCCGLEGIEDARRVAYKLGIRHYVVNMQKVLEKKVITNFLLEYLRGRTPNPCVVCNQYVKFDALLKKALSLGASYLATGHYARIFRARKQYLLSKAKDLNKDQSYFLYRLGQQQLGYIKFPLGGFTKQQVRQIAQENGLMVAEKKESQEICFLPGEDYRDFLRQKLKNGVNGNKSKIITGKVIDKNGNVLGIHKGIAFYTIGQREGLGIACGYPVYITNIDPRENIITVGRQEEVFKKIFLVKELCFTNKPIKKKIAAKVKIRYNHREAEADILPMARSAEVIFKKPQFAITPGQSAVFYDQDKVLGGGIIEKVLD